MNSKKETNCCVRPLVMVRAAIYQRQEVTIFALQLEILLSNKVRSKITVFVSQLSSVSLVLSWSNQMRNEAPAVVLCAACPIHSKNLSPGSARWTLVSSNRLAPCASQSRRSRGSSSREIAFNAIIISRRRESEANRCPVYDEIKPCTKADASGRWRWRRRQ